MEFDPFAQLEAPQRRADLLPRRGERRNDLEFFVVANQRIVDPQIGGDVQALVLRVRIHRQDIALAGPLESLGQPDAGQEERSGKGGGKEDTAHGKLQEIRSSTDGYCQQVCRIVKRFLRYAQTTQGITRLGHID